MEESTAKGVPEPALSGGGVSVPEGGPEPEDPTPAKKRPRRQSQTVNKEKIVDEKTLPNGPLQDVPLNVKGQLGLRLKVFAGNKIFVANTSDPKVHIPVGYVLRGFGKKGKSDRNSNGNFNPDCHHMFHIKTCDYIVCMSKMVTVKEVAA